VAKKKINLKPGDKVILFRPSHEPCVAWICKEVFTKSIFYDAKNPMVKVTAHEKEMEQGKGIFISSIHIQSYTDDLWYACEEWMARLRNQDKDLKKLKKGKIPDGYKKVSQD